ncbi:MAG: DNA translocase FtsK, partial [Oscillospiraceae bacterium]|nr:DNA translocase FtsK [Oscillospiraceae bacterium]
AVQVLFNGDTGENNLFQYIKYLYEDGVDNTFGSGGVVSVILAYPLLNFLGTTGARIVMVLLILTLMFWVSKKSPRDLIYMMTHPFGGNEDDEETDAENAEPDIPMDYVNGDAPAEGGRTPLRKRIRSFFSSSSDAEDSIDDTGAAAEELAVPPIPEEMPDPEYEQSPYEGLHPDYMPVEEPAEEPETSNPNSLDAIIHNAPAPETADPAVAEGIMRTPYGLPQEEEEAAAEEVVVPANFPKAAYLLPPTHFLKKGTMRANDASVKKEQEETYERLVKTLDSFHVTVEKIENGIKRGPAVTRYEVKPASGVKVSRITNLADDIALNLAASGVRIEAPIPGKAAIGIEVPNTTKDTVALRDILESKEFMNSKSKLTFAVGKDIAGSAIVGDVAKMPHMIIAGSTGSGKSVCTNSIIMSILMNASPEDVKMILIDPKIVEFRVYEGIPHLLIPVVTDPKKAAGALNWAVQEMLRRYKLFADNNVRDIYDFNEKAAFPGYDLDKLPQIVIAIDELADLMMAASKEVEDAICRLAQMARAAGMHLIIATQRPTTDIITGLIKANIPSRIALSVMSQIDSRTILDMSGAEKLLGHGDMLYLPNGMPKPIRVQGCYTSTSEIERVVGYIKNQSESTYDPAIIAQVEQSIPVTKGDKSSHSSDGSSDAGNDAELIEQAIDFVVQMGQASTSSLQRRLKLGYARAARIMDELEKMGVIGPYEGAKPRRVLLTPQENAERKNYNMK